MGLILSRGSCHQVIQSYHSQPLAGTSLETEMNSNLEVDSNLVLEDKGGLTASHSLLSNEGAEDFMQ